MILLPFYKNEIEIKLSKADFIQKLKSITAFGLDNYDDSTYSKKPKKYAREIFDSYFILWRVPEYSGLELDFINTTINCRIIEKENRLYLKYYIRFNVFSYIVMSLLSVISFFFLYDLIYNPKSINYSIIIFLTGWLPFSIYFFNLCVKEDIEFINSLTK